MGPPELGVNRYAYKTICRAGRVNTLYSLTFT
jgi:hypothetical protein